MSLLLAPYTNAMRLGQGFNSYTQQICVDDAVVIDPTRAENVITNDGTTMRIVAETSGKPSVWNRIREVVNEGPTANANLLEAVDDEDSTPSGESGNAVSAAIEDAPAAHELAKSRTDDTVVFRKQEQDPEEDAALRQDVDKAGEGDATGEVDKADEQASENGSAVKVDAEDAKENTEGAAISQADAPGDDESPTEGGGIAEEGKPNRPKTSGDFVNEDEEAAKSKSSTAKIEKAAVMNRPGRSSSVENKQNPGPADKTDKRRSSFFQFKETPTRTSKAATTENFASTTIAAKPTASALVKTKPADEVEKERLRLEKAERLEMMRLEKQRLAEERAYQRKLELQAREDERERRSEEREEQKQIRKEQREYEAARRQASQQAIADAAAKQKEPLTLEQLSKIKAQNQFADRFDGIVQSDEKYTFDASAVRGPSQTVTYSSRFVDRLSDVTDDMSISGALSVKMAKIGGSGRGSFVDSDKFKESDLNFYISVKVVNQTVNFKDALIYNPMRSVAIGSDDHNKVYGDSFISGFQEGGEFNAIISMKVHNKAKLLDIQAEAKVALTAGPVDLTATANVGIARTNLEMNTETTIQVSWCGGGHIKPMEQPWNIQSVMQAAARFPSLVANCPQRTHAILTKYESLRSFVSRKPAAYSPLQYENAQIYTNVLMDAFMSYKSLYKKLGDDVTRIQAKTLEFEPWKDTESEMEPKQTNSSQANTLLGQAHASGDPVAVAAAKKYAAAVAAANETKRFDANLRGIADARKFIRRQMVYIVNEVDLIEKDPKVATDDDHEEPFQSPLLFETRLPATKIPDALKPNSNPLGGKRIMAKTQTEEDLEREQKEREEAEADSPALYSMDQDLTTEETTAFDEVRQRVPQIGKHLLVSKAIPTLKSEEGSVFFNNLEFLYPEWQPESITIGMTKQGVVGSVEVVYDNGLILRRGLPAQNLVFKTLTGITAGEKLASAAIEIGAPVERNNRSAEDAVRVLSICMYTNRGRRLLGQAVRNELLKGDRVRKDGFEYEGVKTLFLDSAFSSGTFKGFFGRVSMDPENGGILRLGIVWGNSISKKLSTTVAEAAPVYDVDAVSTDAIINTYKEERDQARRETQEARVEGARQADQAAARARQEMDRERADIQRKISEEAEKQKQITFGNGLYSGRQSVTFQGDSFVVPPSDNAFLRFGNGTQFKYQLDGNLVVYGGSGQVLWATDRYGPGAANLIFHGGNDGNLVAWRSGGAFWETNTKDCRGGFLVLSSERPFLEVFRQDGVRRCNYP